jgi:hypothetical protein
MRDVPGASEFGGSYSADVFESRTVKRMWMLEWIRSME